MYICCRSLQEWMAASRTVVDAYLNKASAGLRGHVLKRLGDGRVALFGYPSAQENDAERAVRAALGIQRALAGLNARNAPRGSPEFAGRIGLNSGPAVIDATGEPFGEAPNLAARVQAAAEPGTVLVTAAVHSGRLRDCSSPRTAAHIRSKARRRLLRSTSSCGQ